MTESSTPKASAAVRPRRDLRWILIGVLAICLGGLGSAVLYSSVANASSVLKVNRTIIAVRSSRRPTSARSASARISGLRRCLPTGPVS